MTDSLQTLPSAFGPLDVPSSADFQQVDGQEVDIAAAFAEPIGLPQLHHCAIPGDRVVLVVDPETPQIVDLISHAWEQLHSTGLDDLRVTILFPPAVEGTWSAIIDQLPVHVRDQATIHVHDPNNDDHKSYLASSSTDDRIYLSSEIVEADLIIILGVVCFDSAFGTRGAASAIFPVFSDADGRSPAGQQPGVSVVGEERPLRKLANEVGWLLGTQFTVQVVPNSAGTIHTIHCGAPEDALAAAEIELRNNWQLGGERNELVCLTCSPTLPLFSWDQAAKALLCATSQVAQGGRVLVIADLPEPHTPALQALRRSNQPSDLRAAFTTKLTPDAEVALALLDVFEQATVLLLSHLPVEVTEELGFVAVADRDEAQRLLDNEDAPCVIAGANWCSAGATVFSNASNLPHEVDSP